jgi:uncharacterized membrane-anchored protein
MMRLTQLVNRVPRPVLFALAGIIQVALIAAIVLDRAAILREGTEVMLQTRPVDPRDLLRGDYVALGYDISTVPAGELEGTPARDDIVLVKLAPKPDGFYGAVSVHAAPVPLAPGEVLIRGRTAYGVKCGDGHAYCKSLQVAYGLERYFVPEGEGRVIEEARGKQKVAVVAAVSKSGHAAIKRLLIDGKPVYDEPMF